MKRRLLALLMSLVMILSVLPGAAFAEPADSSDVLTYADLADIDSSITTVSYTHLTLPTKLEV